MNYILDPINLIPIALFIFGVAVFYPRLALTAIIVILASHFVGAPVITLPPAEDWMTYGFLAICASPLLTIIVLEGHNNRHITNLFDCGGYVSDFKFYMPIENNDLLKHEKEHFNH